MEDAKGTLYTARLSPLASQEFVRKILKLGFPVQILFFKWAEEAVWWCLL